MKKLLTLTAILTIAAILYAGAADSGVTSLIARDPVGVLKIKYATITDLESHTFHLNGFIHRIVVDVTNADADADIVITDGSGVPYFQATDKLGSGDISLAVTEDDVGGDPISPIPVFGSHTLQVTDAAGAGATNIYIYYTQ